MQCNEYHYAKSYRTMIQINSVLCNRHFLLLLPIFYFWNRSGYLFQVDNFFKYTMKAHYDIFLSLNSNIPISQ